jgi:NAD(P)-dependent dehydrogenase (short-subunit alcohol dehydrogenase family)
VPADLSTPGGCQGLAATIDGPLHILVNNAGATWGAPLEEFPASGWDKVLDTNVKGPFHLTVALLPRLHEAATPEAPARVVNIGSVEGIHVPAMENYS